MSLEAKLRFMLKLVELKPLRWLHPLGTSFGSNLGGAFGYNQPMICPAVCATYCLVYPSFWWWHSLSIASVWSVCASDSSYFDGISGIQCSCWAVHVLRKFLAAVFHWYWIFRHRVFVEQPTTPRWASMICARSMRLIWGLCTLSAAVFCS